MSDTDRPLRIVSGSPTAEEIAVVTALVLASGNDGAEPEVTAQRGRWSDPAYQHRRPLLSGVGGWRAANR